MKLVDNACGIRWHLVNRHLHPGVTVREKLSEKIAALSKLLVHFPPDSVHLQVVLDKLAKKGLFEARLTLRLPSNILHVEKTGTDLLVTINTAVQALRREIMGLKAELRGDYRWRRRTRRADLRATKGSRFPSVPPTDCTFRVDGSVPTAEFAAHHAALLAHATRVLKMAELTGDLPSRAIDGGDIVDEVARIVLDPLAKTPKPVHMSYQQWFFRLVREEVDRQERCFAEEMRLRVTAREETNLLSNEAEGDDTGRSLDLWRQTIEPGEESLPEERLADGEAVPPDAAIAGQELVECLQREVKTWPSPEREVFELHYLVGLEVGDISMISHLAQDEVQAMIGRIQLRLRDCLRRVVSATPPDLIAAKTS